jgi:hypothetical protein
MNFIASLICVFIISVNLFLYKNTKNKMEKYNQFPPFILLDHTHSNRVNSNNKISYLLDKNPKTFWKKESPRIDTGWSFDIDLEIKLTHIYDGKNYKERVFHSLEIIPCSEEIVEWEVEVYLREAINVDKELRWPGDKVLIQKKVKLGKKKTVLQLPAYSLGDQQTFPSDNIRIIGFRARTPEVKGCLEDIVLK